MDDRNINTGGGSNIEGDAKTEGGDFVGRDKHEHHEASQFPEKRGIYLELGKFLKLAIVLSCMLICSVSILTSYVTMMMPVIPVTGGSGNIFWILAFVGVIVIVILGIIFVRILASKDRK